VICVICGRNVPRREMLKHIESHFYVDKNEVVNYFKNLCEPFEVRFHEITCVDPSRCIIFFSPENALLFIAFAKERYGIDWKKCCEWMALHEKSHIELNKLYKPPPEVNKNIVSNVEDYYIETKMIPKEYRDVCIANAEMVLEFRRVLPFPKRVLMDRDVNAYYYVSLATWKALGIEIKLSLVAFERVFVENASEVIRSVKKVEDLPNAMIKVEKLHRFFYSLYY